MYLWIINSYRIHHDTFPIEKPKFPSALSLDQASHQGHTNDLCSSQSEFNRIYEANLGPWIPKLTAKELMSRMT